MAQLKDNMTQYISRDDVMETVDRLAKELEIDYHGKEVVMIAPLKGSFLFMADLTRKMTHPKVNIDFVYLKSMKSGEAVEIKKDIETNGTYLLAGKFTLTKEMFKSLTEETKIIQEEKFSNSSPRRPNLRPLSAPKTTTLCPCLLNLKGRNSSNLL